jgi:hypothetical protein
VALLFLVPAAVMPVPAQVGLVVGNDDHMEGSGRDRVVAARADVFLPGLVGLDGRDGYVGRIAHTIAAMAAAPARTITTMSAALLSCFRKGLKPTA